ncbi:MAG: phosphatidylserine decarboxylase [Proteobacteria bacterium]|nr:MAG: phosphatidylserine decarboxylase [Pseudomonadota bacterium]
MSLVGVAPLRVYGRLVRAAAAVPVPRAVRSLLWGRLAEQIGMDLTEAEHDACEYRTFAALFTRRLRGDARPAQADPSAIVSPVDGCISSIGIADGERLLQAKGMDYSLRELVGDDRLADRLTGGVYLTLYLRPKDYHRIHAPVAGRVCSCRRWPGTVFPVQPSFLRNMRGLFVRNERLVLELETALGVVAAVFVGAAAVGAIATPFEDGQASYRRFDPPIEVERGDEIGTFNLGSTVILLFEPNSLQLAPLGVGDEVRVGQAVAHRGRVVS